MRNQEQEGGVDMVNSYHPGEWTRGDVWVLYMVAMFFYVITCTPLLLTLYFMQDIGAAGHVAIVSYLVIASIFFGLFSIGMCIK